MKRIHYTVGVAMTLFSLLFSAETAFSQEDDQIVEEIVVFGIRSSIENARELKREADTNIEAITSIEIGQFVDDSIAGALQRIPGVQIEVDSAGTDGDRVSIRGLGPEFVNSSINGRTLLSSGNEAKSLRKMNFNVFPSSVLSGVRVAKGSTAARPESGMAGQVDLQTLRPLDIRKLKNKNTFGSLSLRGVQRDLYDDTGSRVSGIFAWKSDSGTVGMFIGAATGESDIAIDQAINQNRITRNLRIDTDRDGAQDDTLTGVIVPNASTNFTIPQEQSRDAISAGLQFRPENGPEVIFDVTYTEFDNQSTRNNGQIVTAPVWGATVFQADNVIVDEENFLRYLDFGGSAGNRPVLRRLQNQIYNNVTENLITGINLDWNTGRLNTNLDVYVSTVDYAQNLRFPIFNKNLDSSQIIYDGLREVPTWTLGADANDPAGYRYLFSIVREIELDGKNHGATLAFDLELEDDFFSSFAFGVHYEKTDVDSVRSLNARFSDPTNAVAIAAAGVTSTTRDPFLSDIGFEPSSWLISDFGAVAAIDPAVLTTGVDNLGVDPAASHHSNEKILSLYGQFNIDGQLGSNPLTGNIGLRAILTDHSSSAFTVGSATEPVPVTTGSDYWEYLPSVNLNWSVREDMALRFGLAKTMSRPAYQEMAPIINVNIPISTPEDPNPVGIAKAGNPDLDPITAWNVDLTLEWYNELGGSVVASVFFKAVSDFIIPDLQLAQTVPGQPDSQLFDVTQPVNFSDGDVKGFELGFYQPFEELLPALAGFGLLANYTYVDSSFDEDVGNSGFGFPGTSESNYNVTMFYENDWLTTRLSYVFRDEFFRSLAGQGSQSTDARFTGDNKTLDLNVTVRLIEGLSVSLNALNLTDDKRRDHLGREDHWVAYFDHGRTYAMTATYKF
jgi:iron complex outermembrane recepter protein